MQKRESLEDPPFQRFSPERESGISIFWATICFATSTLLKRASVGYTAWNTCKFLLKDMAVSNMLDIHLANTVHLVEMEFKQFVVNTLAQVSAEADIKVTKKSFT